MVIPIQNKVLFKNRFKITPGEPAGQWLFLLGRKITLTGIILWILKTVKY